MNCPSCQSPLPANARYCAKCGSNLATPAPTKAGPPASRAHPARAPIPREGRIVFSLLVLGVALAAGGYSAGFAWVGITGTILVALILLLMLFGDAIF